MPKMASRTLTICLQIHTHCQPCYFCVHEIFVNWKFRLPMKGTVITSRIPGKCAQNYRYLVMVTFRLEIYSDIHTERAEWQAIQYKRTARTTASMFLQHCQVCHWTHTAFSSSYRWAKCSHQQGVDPKPSEHTESLLTLHIAKSKSKGTINMNKKIFSAHFFISSTSICSSSAWLWTVTFLVRCFDRNFGVFGIHSCGCIDAAPAAAVAPEHMVHISIKRKHRQQSRDTLQWLLLQLCRFGDRKGI